MDFFAHQDRARKKTSLLVFYYVLAVIFIMAGIYLAFAATFIGVKAKTDSEVTTTELVSQLWNLELFLWVIGAPTST